MINGPSFERMLFSLEECISRAWPISIVAERRDYQLIPLKLLYLEDKLSLVGEIIEQKNLAIFQLELIETVRPLSTKLWADNLQIKNYTPPEVDKFIRANWSLNNSEIRPVLKIFDGEMDSLLPPYLFYLDSYITLNGDNNYIWGLSVERSLGLLSWLAHIGDKIEIIDPLQLQWDVDGFRRIVAAWKRK